MQNYSKQTAQEIANYLSQNGHTVILSQKNSLYKIYIGPYKNIQAAKKMLDKISTYSKYAYQKIVKF